MGQGESSGLIWWLGSLQDLTCRLLRAGSDADVVILDESFGAGQPVNDQVARLQRLIDERPRECIGVALAPGLAALRVSAGADGLAKAVGWADSLAFAGGLPGAFAFLARVGGMVAAVREALGQSYCHRPAHIGSQGPEAWAALAALTQLRATGISAVPDAMTGAVAHRMGVELARIGGVGAGRTGVNNHAGLGSSAGGGLAGGGGATGGNATGGGVTAGGENAPMPGGTIRFDSSGFRIERGPAARDSHENDQAQCGSIHVGNDAIELHTVAAQLRLFTSREPDVAAMRGVVDERA